MVRRDIQPRLRQARGPAFRGRTPRVTRRRRAYPTRPSCALRSRRSADDGLIQALRGRIDGRVGRSLAREPKSDHPRRIEGESDTVHAERDGDRSDHRHHVAGEFFPGGEVLERDLRLNLSLLDHLLMPAERVFVAQRPAGGIDDQVGVRGRSGLRGAGRERQQGAIEVKNDERLASV